MTDLLDASQSESEEPTAVLHAVSAGLRVAEVNGEYAPAAPVRPDDCGVELQTIADLALKLANTVPRLTTQWAAEQLQLPIPTVEGIFWDLREDQLLEVLGQSGLTGYRYAITQRGREHARRLLEISGYVGPAPVSLDAYSAMLQWQLSRMETITPAKVREALSPLVLAPDALEVATLAASSGRSLFLFGPPGNGKTTLARLLHDVLSGYLWIPHCISVDSNVIRVFDPQCHQLAPEPLIEEPIDRRWVRVRRPFIVAGGEMTIDELDLAYSPALRFYEAPPHVKANGGLFVLDDFGRQNVEPHHLLNRWIIPLEQQVDHLTLNTGQKIRVPFKLMLVIATNLKVADVADPAFLRRMGYRLHLDRPTPERYREIFKRYAQSAGLEADDALAGRVLDRYASENRELRASEPRDLLDRVRDICTLRDEPARLNDQTFDLAWRAYFSDV